MRQKSKTKIWFIAFLLVAVLGLGGLARADLDFKTLLAEKIAANVSPQILEKLNSVDNVLGLNVINTSNTGLTNVRIGGELQQASSETQTYYTVTQYDVEPWPTATTTISFKNDQTVTSTVSVQIVMSGVVSSTVNFSCGTSTTGFVAYDTSDEEPQNLIDDYQAATSTYGKVISSIDGGDNGTAGFASAELAPNQYLTCFAQNIYVAGCTGSICESVTSTNRGWSAIVRAQYEWFEGISNTQLSK